MPSLSSPSSLANKRRIADALAQQGMSSAPLQSPWQVAGNLAQAAAGAYGNYQADQQEEQGRASAREEMAKLLQGNPDNAAIMGAMDNPWLSDGQGRMAELLMKNNLKQQGIGEESKYGLNPIWAQDEQGNWQLYQPNQSGGDPAQVNFPEGVMPQPQTTLGDFGTFKQPITTRGGRPTGAPMPVDITGREAAEKTGQAQGTAAGAAPAAAITAQQTVQKIDELLADPELGSISGWQSYLPDAGVAAMGSSHALALRRRVEQLRGTAFLEAYNGLRGGGQITEVEGRKAEDAMARLDTAQSDEDYVSALKDFRDAVLVGYQKLAATAGGNAPELNIQQPTQQERPGVGPRRTQGGVTYQVLD